MEKSQLRAHQLLPGQHRARPGRTTGAAAPARAICTSARTAWCTTARSSAAIPASRCCEYTRRGYPPRISHRKGCAPRCTVACVHQTRTSISGALRRPCRFAGGTESHRAAGAVATEVAARKLARNSSPPGDDTVYRTSHQCGLSIVCKAANRPSGTAQRELSAVPRDTPLPFQSYEPIGASEKVSHGVLAGCQLVEDSAVSPSLIEDVVEILCQTNVFRLQTLRAFFYDK